MRTSLELLVGFRDFCQKTRGETVNGSTVGIQAIPDIITRTQLSIGSFGGADAPWAQTLMTSWNDALQWRKNEASTVSRELQLFADSLNMVAIEYGAVDQESADGINDAYQHG